MFVFAWNFSFAQNAITSEGRTVFLKNDGTWEYTDMNRDPHDIRDLNDSEFSVDKNATFLVKSQLNPKYGIYLNPKKWNFEVNDNPDQQTEYILKTKINGSNVFGSFAANKEGKSIEELRQKMVEEVESVDSNMEIVKEEYRLVNGKKMLYMKMNGDVMHIHFTVFFYLYADGEDNVVAEIHTSKNLDDYKATEKILQMLNNIVAVK